MPLSSFPQPTPHAPDSFPAHRPTPANRCYPAQESPQHIQPPAALDRQAPTRMPHSDFTQPAPPARSAHSPAPPARVPQRLKTVDSSLDSNPFPQPPQPQHRSTSAPTPRGFPSAATPPAGSSQSSHSPPGSQSAPLPQPPDDRHSALPASPPTPRHRCY